MKYFDGIYYGEQFSSGNEIISFVLIENPTEISCICYRTFLIP